MTTFSENKYLPYTIYLDGTYVYTTTYNIEEPFDHDNYVNKIEETIEMYRAILDGNATGEVREDAKEQIDSLENLKLIIKAIWEPDSSDFFEFNTEEDEE